MTSSVAKHDVSGATATAVLGSSGERLLNVQQCKDADGVEPNALHNRWTRVDVRYADRQVSLRTQVHRYYGGAAFGHFTYTLLKA